MRARNARDLAYEEIRTRILTLELQPDERIDETGLAESIGVSRTPVREAIQILISDELVVEAPRGGYVVSNVTIGKFRALMEAQDIVVQSVAQLLVAHAADADLDRIEEATRSFDEAEKTGDPAQIAAKNADLHILEATLTGNPYLAGMARKVHVNLQRLAYLSFGGAPGGDLSAHYERVHDDHWEYLEALRARDARAAVAIAMRHAKLFEQRVLSYMTSVGEVSVDLGAGAG